MPRIAVISHKFDKFNRRYYLLAAILKELEGVGVTYEVTAGPKRFVEADLAILHVDSTIVEPGYVALARRYRRALNIGVTDIRKSRVSAAALSRDEKWQGPVLVKTELNGRGAPEFYHNEVARLRGKPLPHPEVTALRDYELYKSAADVPAAVWRDPQLAVEKFLPEIDAQGYGLRTWCFFGARETCSRCIGANPMVKGADVIARELIPVPDALREQRARLGFDYGKFDFVMHEGAPILLDANITPTVPERLSDALAISAKELAQGLLEML